MSGARQEHRAIMPHLDTSERYDVLVIGSGFGGAISACRLAQAGRSVALLEKGRRWAPHEFPRAVGPVSQAFWREGATLGFLEYRTFRRFDVIQGVGVGGGSLHYFNVHLRADAEIFEREPWPVAITRSVLDPYYELAQDMMESRVLEPPAAREVLPPRTRVFLDAARRVTDTAALVDIAVHTGAARPHPASGVLQSACTYCSNCLFGCDIHAKNTLDITYLGLAERRHGLKVLPLHEAICIARDGAHGYRVDFLHRSEDPRAPPRAGALRARSVIVAAGTLGSLELLLRCRDEHRTLPALGAALGSRVSLNGELLSASACETRQRVDPGIGPPITARATVRAGRHLITVEDLGVPDALFWYVEGMLPPRLTRVRRLGKLAAAYARDALGWQRKFPGARPEIEALVAGGRTPHMLPFLVMGTDSSDGRARLTGRELVIDWSHAGNRELYRSIDEVLKRISTAAGGKFVRSLFSRWPLRKVLTAHPLGGCPMGEEPDTSVVNDRGEVHGLPDLYVVDGSIVPAALAVNPSLTISALAERAAFWMVHGREMRAADPQAPRNR
jgi:cholesterol oxidase